MEDKIEILYNGLKDRYDLGELESFRSKMSDPAKQKAFYDAVNSKVDLGTFEEFSSKISQKKSPDSSVSSVGSSSQESAPVVAPKSEPTPPAYSLTVTDISGAGSTAPTSDAAPVASETAMIKKDVASTQKRIALNSVRESRKGDYQFDAVERLENGLSDYEKAELSQKTPLERLFNTDVTSKQYRAQSLALSKDQEMLDKGIDAIDEELIKKFGDNAFDEYDTNVEKFNELYQEYTLAQKSGSGFSEEKTRQLNELRESIDNFQKDPLVQERNGMVQVMQKNLARFEEMQKADNYQGVREMIETQKEIQRQTDDQSGGMISNIAIKNIAKMVSGVARLTDTAEKAVGLNKEYNKLDAVQNFFIDLADDAEMLFPTPGQFSRQLNTSTAKWNGYEVDVNGENLTFIKDGKPVEVEVSDEQKAEILSLPRESQWNFIGAPYQLAQVVGDMGVMIAGAGKITKGLSAIGVGKAAAARTGVALSTAGQMAGQLYEQGLEIFDNDKQKASQYAIFGGLSIGLASNIFGLESRLVNGTKGLTAAIPKMNVPAAVGQMSVKQRAIQAGLSVVRQGVGEGVEESIFENGVLALNAAMLGGKAEMPSQEEMLSEGAMGFAAGVLFAGGTVQQDLNDIQKSSLLAASQNPELFGNRLREEIAAGRIQGDEEFISKQMARATRIGAELEKLSPDIKGDRLLDAVELLDAQGEIQGRLDEVKGNETLEARYQAELDKINLALSETFKSAEPEVEEEPVAEEPQEEGIVDRISEKVDRSPVKEKLGKIVNRTIEDDVALDLSSGRRLRTSDYDNSGDRNNRKGSGIALRYMSKDGERIDAWAQELADKWGIDEKDAEQIIIDVINNNPEGLKDYAERRLAEDMAIEESFTNEVDEVVDSIPEEQAQMLETFLEQFEVNGELDEDALEAAFNEAEAGFSPEFLELQENAPQAYQELKNIINERAEKVSETQEVDTPFSQKSQEKEKAAPGKPMTIGDFSDAGYDIPSELQDKGVESFVQKEEGLFDVKLSDGTVLEDVSIPKREEVSEETGEQEVEAENISPIPAQEASTTSDATSEVSKIAPLDKKIVGLAYGNPEKYMGPKKSRKEAEFEGGKLVSTVYEDYTMQEVIANDGSKIQRIVDSNGNPIGDPGLRINIGSKDLKMFTGGKGISVSEAAITKIFKDKFASPESVKIAEQAKAETSYDKNPEQKKIIDSTGRADLLAKQQEEIDVEKAQKEVDDWLDGVKYAGFFTDQDVKKFAKLTYKYIKLGVKTLADFAKLVGKKISQLSQAGWDRAMGRYHAATNDLNIRDSLNFTNSFAEFWADRDKYLEAAVNKIKKAGNFTGSEMDPYLQRELMASKIDAKTKELYEDILGVEAGKIGAKKKNEKSLRARAEKDGITWDRFNDLLYALHAKERNKRVKELMEKRKQLKIDEIDQKIAEESMMQNPDLGKIAGLQADRTVLVNEPPFENGSGMSDAEADAIIAQAQADGVYDPFLEYEKEFREKVLKARVDVLVEGGLLSQDQADTLLAGKREGFDSDFEHYVPLYVKEEFLEEDIPSAGADFISAKVYGLRGSQKTKDQRHKPADMAIVLMAQSIKSAEQNKSIIALAKMVEANPLDRQWKVVPSKGKTKVSPIGELLEIDDYTPQRIKDNAVQFKQDGKTKYVFVMPTEHEGKVVTNPIISIFKHKPGTVNPSVDILLGVARFYHKWMRMILTSIDPSFGLPNAFRDITEAMANTTIYKDEKDLKRAVRRKIISNYLPALKAIATAPWSNGGNKLADNWVEMKKAGVPMTWRNADGVGSDIENLQNYIKNTDPSVKSFFKGIYERMSFINDTLENVTRLATYTAMKDAGVDTDYAAGVAKNITVNFEKKGKAGSVINAFYLFASPGIQGARMTVKLASSKSGMAVLGGIAAASAAMRALLYYQMDDEDLEEYVYNDFKSTQYSYIPNPMDSKNPITIPKSYSLVRVSQTLGEGLVDMMMGKKTAPAVAGDFIANTASVLDPFGGMNRSFGAIVPSILSVPADLAFNMNWAGSKVYHFDFDPAKPDKFELNTGTFGEKMPIPFTDIEYTELARYLYDYGLDASPTTLEYVSKAYFTGIIKTVYNLENTVESIIKNEELDSRKVPILSRFYQDVSDTQKNMLYNIYEITEKTSVTDDQKKYLKRKMPDVKRLMSPQSYRRLKATIEKKFFTDKDKWMREEQKKFDKRAKKAEKINIFR